jgi:O-antigen ligase
MMNNGFTKPAVLNGPRLWRWALTLLAATTVVVSGVALGRVLFTQAWTHAVTVVGLAAALLLFLLDPTAGLLAWIFLAPYAHHIYLRLNLGGGIPDLDLTRLATVFLTFLLILQATVPRANKDPRQETGRSTRLGPAAVPARRPPYGDLRLARLGWPELAMIAFVVAMAFSIPNSSRGVIATAQAQFDFVLVPMLMYYFGRNLLCSQRALMGTVGVVALTAALFGIIVTREQLTGAAVFSPVHFGMEYETSIRKVLSLFGNPVNFATSLGVAVPILLYGIRRAARSEHRGLLGLALLLGLAGLFFAYVRAGWLGAIVAIALIVALSPDLRRALLPLLPVIALAGLLLTAVVIRPEIVQERLTSERPISYRLQAWEIAWKLFRQSPLMGIGYEQFGPQAVAQFGWRPHEMLTLMPSPHNSYLDVLVSAGLLALIPYVGIFVALAWAGLAYWRQPVNRPLVTTLWATLLSYVLIIGTFDVLNAQYANMLFFLILGAMMGRLEEG